MKIAKKQRTIIATKKDWHCFFSLEVMHSYFADGKYRDFRFLPDRETASILRKYGIRLWEYPNTIYAESEQVERLSGNGFSLWIPNQSPIIDSSEILRINVDNNNLRFWEITEGYNDPLSQFDFAAIENDPGSTEFGLFKKEAVLSRNSACFGTLEIQLATAIKSEGQKYFSLSLKTRRVFYRYIISKGTDQSLAQLAAIYKSKKRP